MHTLQNIILTGLLLLSITSCHHYERRVVVNNGKNKLEISSSGKVTFTDDESAILRMSNNATLKYWRDEVKLRVTSDENGTMHTELFNDGKKIDPESPEGRKLMAEVIKEMISVGFDAEARYHRIIKSGGIAAVLEDIDRQDNDFLKSMYLGFLISGDSLQPEQWQGVAERIATAIGSDFEKSKLLRQIPTERLNDSLLFQSYFNALRTIGSDFEKANAMKQIVKHSFTTPQYRSFLETANTLGSDFEKANLLKELISVQLPDSGAFQQLMDSVHTIGSDFEKANVMKQLVNHSFTTPQYLFFLETVNTMGSDLEKANLLKNLISVQLPDGIAFQQLLASVNAMGSDFEKGSVLKSIAAKNLSSDEQWIWLINSVSTLGSDFEKANLLLAIADGMPRTESLRMAYLTAAKNINSQHERERAVRAME